MDFPFKRNLLRSFVPSLHACSTIARDRVIGTSTDYVSTGTLRIQKSIGDRIATATDRTSYIRVCM